MCFQEQVCRAAATAQFMVYGVARTEPPLWGQSRNLMETAHKIGREGEESPYPFPPRGEGVICLLHILLFDIYGLNGTSGTLP